MASASILVDAIQNNNVDTIRKFLDEGGDVNTKLEGKTLLYIAADEWCDDIVELLLEMGANPNALNDNGDVALVVPICYNKINIVRMLLEAGANVNFSCPIGHTALVLAAFTGDPDLLLLLLGYGVNVNLQNNLGQTGLHWAAYYARKDMIEILLEAGADYTLRTKD